MCTIYGYEDNPRTRILRIVALAEDIPVVLSEVIPRKNVNKEAYLARFPLSQGKIPALEHGDLKLTETISIATYLSRLHQRQKLLGNEGLQQETRILTWVCWANQELLPLLATWFLPLIPNFTDPSPYDYTKVEQGKLSTLKLLTRLESHLARRKTKFLETDNITLADIFVAIYISRGLQWVLDTSWRECHPHVMHHFSVVANWEYVKAIIPNFTICEVARPNRDPYMNKNE